MRLRRTSVLPLFLAAAGLMAGSLIFSFVVGRRAVETNQRLDAERMVLEHLERYLSGLKDGETGERGFVLTGDPAYLDPYQTSLLRMESESEMLRRHARSGDLPAGGVETLLRLGQIKLGEMARVVAARREQGFDSALALIRTHEGKTLMDQIRTEVERLASEQRGDIDRAVGAVESAQRVRVGTFVAAILFNLAFIGWAYRRLSREIRRQEEAMLEVSRQQELLGTTLVSIGDGVIVTDAHGRVTFQNGEAERLTGWPAAEAKGTLLPEVFRIVNEHSRELVISPVEKVLQEGAVVGLANHTILLSRSGREIPIDDSAAPIRLPGGELFGVVLVFRDVTEQRALDEARTRLAAIVESSADAIVSKTLDGTIRTWNVGAERLFGYRAEEIIGRSITRIIPPEEQKEESEILGRLRRGESVERQLAFRIAKDGRRIPVSATSSPLRGPEGTVVGASTIIRDMTDIVAAQRALARSREELEQLVLERTAKLRELIGELQHVSYAITHDMRAPLRAMGMFAELLLEDAAARNLSAEALDYCRRIVTAVGRMDALIQDALNYNRAVLQELPLGPVALGPLLAGLIESYPNLQPDKAEIRIEGALPVVQGNTSLLTQCFSNLLGNAVKFVAPGVRPRVRIRAERRESLVRVWVEDNGIGIPRDAQSRLFGMFQKLNDQYEGTGVGLAIVRKVVERMGGAVGLESEPGQGSRFWVDLPLPRGSP